MSITLLSGDCLDVLPTLAANSVHCVVTSPPYYGLRDYGTAQWDGGDAECQHLMPPNGVRDKGRDRAVSGGTFHDSPIPNQIPQQFRDTCGKCGARRVDRQIGLEATPDEYLATMVGVFREVKRVMRSDAVAFVNMGDGYRDKQLQMIPARLAIALQADGWFLRSDIIWHKPNPMPESVTDRPTSAHEHVFLLTKRATYFYDAEAVREPQTEGTIERFGNGNAPRKPAVKQGGTDRQCDTWRDPIGVLPNGRNCRNVWTIATQAFSESHFATMPTAVVERCIRAGTSERGCCAACGAPWRRESESHIEHTQRIHTHPKYGNEGQYQHAAANRHRDGHIPGQKIITTTGWSPSCACAADVVPATVLDVFAGAGTTLLVADRLQRNAIGIELNASYTTMAMDRCRADAPLFADAPEPQPVPGFAQPDLFPDAERTEIPAPKLSVPAGWDTGPGAHGTIHRDGRTQRSDLFAEAAD